MGSDATTTVVETQDAGQPVPVSAVPVETPAATPAVSAELEREALEAGLTVEQIAGVDPDSLAGVVQIAQTAAARALQKAQPTVQTTAQPATVLPTKFEPFKLDLPKDEAPEFLVKALGRVEDEVNALKQDTATAKAEAAAAKGQLQAQAAAQTAKVFHTTCDSLDAAYGLGSSKAPTAAAEARRQEIWKTAAGMQAAMPRSGRHGRCILTS